MNTNFPKNIEDFFSQHPDKYQLVFNKKFFIICIIIAIVCGFLAYFLFFHQADIFQIIGADNSSVKSRKKLSVILFSVGAFFAVIFAGAIFNLFTNTKTYILKESGKIISILKTWMFNEADKDKIIQIFENNDFNNLTEIPEDYDGKIYLEVYSHEAEKEKIFFLQVVQKVEDKSRIGLTEVKKITGNDYKKYEEIFFKVI